ncbi:MAG: hypothetical protein ACFE8A_00735 [Candidatus Hodarchaeota archaeon]
MSIDEKGKNSEKKEVTNVLTVRIDQGLDQILEEIKDRKHLTKANVIRNYLEMAKYLIIDQSSIRSLDDRDLIVIKRSTFKKFLENLEEEAQMELGIKFARLINDIARVQNQLENLDYKLDLCVHLGFFPKFIDKENYILFSNKFGPAKFVEGFVYKLINYTPEDEYEIALFTTEAINKDSKKKKDYVKKIGPIDRTKSYYAFEFAKLEKEE